MMRRRKFQVKPILANKSTSSTPAAAASNVSVESATSSGKSTLLAKSTYGECSAMEASSNFESVLPRNVTADVEKESPPVVCDMNVETKVNVALPHVCNDSTAANAATSTTASTHNMATELGDGECSTIDSFSNADLMSPVRKVVIGDEEEDNADDIEVDVDVNETEDELGAGSSSHNLEDPKEAKKRRISALRNEKFIDPKKFTLADLIDWRPSTENTLRQKWAEKRQKLLEQNANNIAKIDAVIESKNEPKFVGPRVRINEKGEMVLDEDSLVVTNETDPNVWETVDDDLMPKKLNSMSFRKTTRTNPNWSVWETDLFYEVLSATGTDFGLMHEFIPGRSRAEIKRKFNREEKISGSRVDEVLEKPTILDETFKERVLHLKEKVELKLAEKIAAKEKPVRGTRRGRPRKVPTEAGDA